MTIGIMLCLEVPNLHTEKPLPISVTSGFGLNRKKLSTFSIAHDKYEKTNRHLLVLVISPHICARREKVLFEPLMGSGR